MLLIHMQSAPVNITVGSHVWAEEPEVVWIDGVVSKINGTEVEVDASNGKKVTCCLLNTQQLNPKSYALTLC